MKCKASSLPVTRGYASLYTDLAFSPVLSEVVSGTYLSLEALQESSAVKYSSLAIFQYLCLFLIFS